MLKWVQRLQINKQSRRSSCQAVGTHDRPDRQTTSCTLQLQAPKQPRRGGGGHTHKHWKKGWVVGLTAVLRKVDQVTMTGSVEKFMHPASQPAELCTVYGLGFIYRQIKWLHPRYRSLNICICKSLPLKLDSILALVKMANIPTVGQSGIQSST
jgi:hypothetical protein